MKRLTALLLTLVTALFATACGPDDGAGASGAPVVEDGAMDPGQQ